MYAITATRGSGSGSFTVRCGNSQGAPTREAFDHAERHPAEAAITAHVGRCAGCRRMVEQGYEPVFGTLPTASGRDGATVAVWLYTARA